jgi:branched-chain amino acid transport system substrate-binding protein
MSVIGVSTPVKLGIEMSRFAIFLVSVIALGGPTDVIAADEVLVGAVTPLSGNLSVYGVNLQKAMFVALDEVNATGGVKGKTMRIEFADNGSTAKGSIAAITKLIEVDRLPIIFGPAASGNFLAVCKIAQTHRTILVAAESAANSIAQCGEYVFRLNPSDRLQAKALARLTIDRGHGRIALTYIDSTWGRELAEDFKTDFVGAGGGFVDDFPHRTGQADFADDVHRLAAAGARAVVVLSHVQETAALLREASRVAFKPRWLLTSAARSPELISAAGAAAEGVLGTYPKVPHNTPQFRAYQAAFRRRYPREPLPFFGAFNYDMVMLAAKTLSRTKSDNPVAIRAALIAAANGYIGASGEKTFDKDGQSPGIFGAWMVKDGHIVDFNPRP